MTLLNELINSEIDISLKEEFQDRLSIVIHKIKFMDKVPVCCLDLNNQIQPLLNNLISLAGGQLVNNIQQAKTVIYFESHQNIENLMAKVASLIDSSWPASTYKSIYLLSDNFTKNDISNVLSVLEDIAEILHPGSFVFGNEGKFWLNFEA